MKNRLQLSLILILIIGIELFQNYRLTKKIESLEMKTETICKERIISTKLILGSSLDDIKDDIDRLEGRVDGLNDRLNNLRISVSY
jgi:hypothetical protein